jgi:C4-type Zn-finger protein
VKTYPCPKCDRTMILEILEGPYSTPYVAYVCTHCGYELPPQKADLRAHRPPQDSERSTQC